MSDRGGCSWLQLWPDLVGPRMLVGADSGNVVLGIGMNDARRQSRTLAMQALYESEATGVDPLVACASLADEYAEGGRVFPYAKRLILGVGAQPAEIDQLLRDAAGRRPLEEIAAVDRAILRLAVWEMRWGGEIPGKVVVNEAIEVAKEYGGESSSRFVNGVLGYILAAGAAE